MRLKDVVVGAIMAGAGIVYLRMTAALPARDGVDAGTVPSILAWMMIALGLIEMVGAMRRPAATEVETRAASSGLVTVALTLLLIAGFIAALRPLGFPIATAVYLFLQFLVLTPQSAKRSVPLYAGLAIASSVLIFATFRYAFDLLLPAGPLVAWLN